MSGKRDHFKFSLHAVPRLTPTVAKVFTPEFLLLLISALYEIAHGCI